MMTKELVNMKELLRDEVKQDYYVVWEQVEICSDETESILTEEFLKVMFEQNNNSSLVPLYSYLIEKPGAIEETLNKIRKECKHIFKETCHAS
ncbi:hypothetical protein N0O92_15290 [Alkalihalobacillus sp. MEB130]|uniref:hypothetical protein n=1 Tax=Alkalihalobacillus sp. MEB130 TaxID=2976704 RepID=UPI0028DF92B6|nr:hypothetical protein [Alkalihalobacillus sp. MEB130]MDT8861581.1 hypothetical protein [Alkalihalobacillus sp. MEB130]